MSQSERHPGGRVDGYKQLGHVYASLQMQHLCETCYAFISVPFSPIGSSSIVDQHMEAVALLEVRVCEIVDACWLCKIKWARDDHISSRNLFPELRHKGRIENRGRKRSLETMQHRSEYFTKFLARFHEQHQRFDNLEQRWPRAWPKRMLSPCKTKLLHLFSNLLHRVERSSATRKGASLSIPSYAAGCSSDQRRLTCQVQAHDVSTADGRQLILSSARRSVSRPRQVRMRCL